MIIWWKLNSACNFNTIRCNFSSSRSFLFLSFLYLGSSWLYFTEERKGIIPFIAQNSRTEMCDQRQTKIAWQFITLCGILLHIIRGNWVYFTSLVTSMTLASALTVRSVHKKPTFSSYHIKSPLVLWYRENFFHRIFQGCNSDEESYSLPLTQTKNRRWMILLGLSSKISSEMLGLHQ